MKHNEDHVKEAFLAPRRIEPHLLDLVHRALEQLFRIVELLEDERDVHLRLTGESFAAAVDAVLADERQRIGQQIDRDGEPPAITPHHRLVHFQRVAVLIEH